MKKHVLILLAVGLGAVLFSGGCAMPGSTTQFYDGPARSPGEVAQLKNLGMSSIVIQDIDGRKAPTFYYGLDVLPGPHTATLKFCYLLRTFPITPWRRLDVSPEPGVLSFSAEAGHRYTLGGETLQDRVAWQPWIKDAGSGREVRGDPVPTELGATLKAYLERHGIKGPSYECPSTETGIYSLTAPGVEGEAAARVRERGADFALEECDDAHIQFLLLLYSNQDLHVRPDIPDAIRMNAVKACSIPAGDDVFAVLDTTLLGSAKNALVVSRRGLSWQTRMMGGDPVFVTYAEFARAKISVPWLKDAVKIGSYKFESSVSDMGYEAVAQMLIDLQLYFK